MLYTEVSFEEYLFILLQYFHMSILDIGLKNGTQNLYRFCVIYI